MSNMSKRAELAMSTGMQLHESVLILNTEQWFNPIRQLLKRSVEVTPEYTVNLFFERFNRVLEDQMFRPLDDRQDVIEALIATFVPDLEASHSYPVEFQTDTIDLLVQLVCFLYDDILTSIDTRCLESPGAQLDFRGFIGGSIMVVYSNYNRPHALPSWHQLSAVRQMRYCQDAEEYPERACL